jgi:hypothetical protein
MTIGNRGVRAQEITLDGLATDLAAQRSLVKSLAVTYEKTTSPLVDMEIVFKHSHNYAMYEESVIEAYDGERLSQEVKSNYQSSENVGALIRKDRPPAPGKRRQGFNMFSLSYAEFKTYLDQVPLEPYHTRIVFDGSKITELGRRTEIFANQPRKMYAIRGLPKQPMKQFMDTYFDAIGWGRRDPGLPAKGENSTRDRLPEIFSDREFTVLEAREEIDGASCVVVESQGYLKLWLDPAKGWTLRKKHIFVGGQLFYEFECHDLKEVVAGVWMPWRIEGFSIGLGAYPPEFVGKRILQVTRTVATLEANRNDLDDYFKVVPEAGALVIDETIPRSDEKGAPLPTAEASGDKKNSVAYVQPAKQADVDSAIKRAQEGLGNVLEPINDDAPGAANWRRWLFVTTAVLAIVAVVWLIVRRRRLIAS